MRLCTYSFQGHDGMGVVENNNVVDINHAFRKYLQDRLRKGRGNLPNQSVPSTMLALLQKGGSTLKSVYEAVEYVRGLPQEDLSAKRIAISLKDVRLRTPITKPPKIICMALVYPGHIETVGATVPEEPGIFIKPHTSLVGPSDPILLPGYSPDRITFGAELCLVIGKGGKNISEARAYDHVAGYTILNDVTARGIKSPGITNKLFDTFAPVGPYIATKDEIHNPQDLLMTVRVNGKVKQSGSTKDMLFKIPHIISLVSNFMSLEPGDLIATGDVGCKDFLSPGDVMETEIQDIGTLVNSVKLE